MKIILEFDNQEELESYLEREFMVRHPAIDRIDVSEGAPLLPDYTRRRGYSAHELDIIKTYYLTKKVTWIAKYLRRKPTAIYQQLHKMYKAGLPRKTSRHGKVSEQLT